MYVCMYYITVNMIQSEHWIKMNTSPCKYYFSGTFMQWVRIPFISYYMHYSDFCVARTQTSKLGNCIVFHEYLILHNGIHYNEWMEVINSCQSYIISTMRSSHQIKCYVLVKWSLLIQEDESGSLELTTSHHHICSIMLQNKTMT